jgi:hypothetical protein
MKLLARMLGVAALLVASACGDGLTDPDDEEDNVFTANVQGAGFVGENFSNFVLTGNRLSFWVSQVVAGGDTHRFEFSLEPVNGPGTFPVGGGNASLVVYQEVSGGVSKYWRTSQTETAGSVTLTTYTPSRIVGNFSFTVGPDGSATGSKAITGSFDFYP